MKFCLLDVHNNYYSNLFALSRPNREEYCKKHGYQFEYRTFDKLEPEYRQANWGRVGGILDVLPHYDWVFYLDTDILIVDTETPAASYIDENYNLVAGPLPQEGHIMTSGMLIKNCDWSYNFLRELYKQEQFITEPYYSPPGKRATGIPCSGGYYFEQSAFHYLYDSKPEYSSKVKLLPRKCFNSETYNYREGDFLIHFPGRYDKERLMQAFIDGRYCQEISEARARDEKLARSTTTGRSKVIGGFGKTRLKTAPNGPSD